MTSHATRRRFLAQAASVVAASVCQPAGKLLRAQAAVEPSPITFSFSLYGMKTLALDRAVEACAELGYDAIELVALRDWPGDPDTWPAEQRRAFRQRLAALKLTLAAVMDSLPPEIDDTRHRAQLERLKRVTEFARELAPDRPPVVETILGGKPGEWSARRELVVARLTDWARIAEQTKTIVAVKPHRFNMLNTPADARWLMEQVASPSIRIGYDYSHFVHRQMPLVKTLDALLPVTAFVHVKDAVERDGKVQFALPGESGDIDYVTLLTRLKQSGYRGTVCVEVSGQVSSQPGYDPIAAARRSYDNLKPAFVKAGISRPPA